MEASTIENVLNTCDFPTDSNNAWINDTGSQRAYAYIDNSNLHISNATSTIDIDLNYTIVKNSNNEYLYEDDYRQIVFRMYTDNSLHEIQYISIGDYDGFRWYLFVTTTNVIY